VKPAPDQLLELASAGCCGTIAFVHPAPAVAGLGAHGLQARSSSVIRWVGRTAEDLGTRTHRHRSLRWRTCILALGGVSCCIPPQNTFVLALRTRGIYALADGRGMWVGCRMVWAKVCLPSFAGICLHDPRPH
jgi:hypothetical protein